MNVKKIEELNQAKLSKRYHKALAEIPDEDIKGVFKAWETGDEEMARTIIKKYWGDEDRDKYYILAIWLHPLEKFSQLAKKLGRLEARRARR